jgi:hypothetical protein
MLLSLKLEGKWKLVEAILRRGIGKRDNNGGDEPNLGTLHKNMEMSQQTLLYDYYILIKMF